MAKNIINLFSIIVVGTGKGPSIDLRKLIRLILFTALITILILLQFSCNKAVDIDQPANSITSEGAFSTDATATAAVMGIYGNLINTENALKIGSGAITLYSGLSSDELLRLSLDGEVLQFRENSILKENAIVLSALWLPAYFNIYQANTCIEGIEKSQTITPAVKSQLLGECKFWRAFLYFYLTNIWGDVPMPLTGSWEKTSMIPRINQGEVYTQIVADLKDAQELLKDDFSYSKNERIRANKNAATALLARVHLFRKNWADAEAQASVLIGNTAIYGLVTNLNSVFLKNSKEAILQLQPSNLAYPWAVVEQNNSVEGIRYYLSDELLNTYDGIDKRKASWISTFSQSGTTYSFPYKYKISSATAPGGSVPEYYMVLRLGEQYLIRAEARARQNKVIESQSDLNAVRTRAGLPNTTANDEASLLVAIEKERQKELFAEWGHRWFDLIRTNRANDVLSPLKGTNWQSTDVLYPIPFSEIQNNPMLSQNEGYR